MTLPLSKSLERERLENGAPSSVNKHRFSKFRKNKIPSRKIHREGLVRLVLLLISSYHGLRKKQAKNAIFLIEMR